MNYVSTIAGSSYSGSLDGPATVAAFVQPVSLTVDSVNDIYVLDIYTAKIRKIASSSREVTTIAGTTRGFSDGTASTAKFNFQGISVIKGQIYVADTFNHRIRVISTSGLVSTVAGTGGAGKVDGSGTSAMFNLPYEMVVSTLGDIYLSDLKNYCIRKISTSFMVSTIAGGLPGSSGQIDGTVSVASFTNIRGIAMDSNGVMFVADVQKIRRVTQLGKVTTIAGGAQGYVDGSASVALFQNLYGIVVDKMGNIYVSDFDSLVIRKYSPLDDAVTTIAGSSLGSNDGSGLIAEFKYPTGMTADNIGDLIVSDSRSHSIRKIKITSNLNCLILEQFVLESVYYLFDL